MVRRRLACFFVLLIVITAPSCTNSGVSGRSSFELSTETKNLAGNCYPPAPGQESPPIRSPIIQELDLARPITLGLPTDVILRLPFYFDDRRVKIQLRTKGSAHLIPVAGGLVDEQTWYLCGNIYDDIELKIPAQVVFIEPGTGTVTASVSIVDSSWIVERSLDVEITASGTVIPPTPLPTRTPTATRHWGIFSPLPTPEPKITITPSTVPDQAATPLPTATPG